MNGVISADIVSLNFFYVIFLFVSGGIFLILKKMWTHLVPTIFFWIHFFIVTWSALMYLNIVYQTPLAPYTYYADWIVSTPLIMLALGLTAMYGSTIKWDILFPLMMTQAMIIVTGVLAQVSESTDGMLAFFSIGNAFMFIIFYLVFGPLRSISSANSELHTKYKALSLLLVLFWISYPVVWIIGSPGYGFISDYFSNVLFVVLPILCKPVFGFIDLYLLKSLKR